MVVQRLVYNTGAAWRVLVASILFVMLFGGVTYGIVQSYITNDDELVPGMVVSLDESSTSENKIVVRAGIADIRRVIGFSTTVEESLVSVARADRPVYVATDGTVSALIADTNGPVRSGDLLRLSSLRGILERANDNEAGIATALNDSDFSNAETYLTSDGISTSAEKIDVSINNQALYSQGDEIAEQSTLEQFGYRVTGKNIGEIRVLAALIIFMLVMIAEGGIIYGAISSSMNALGRNPLAKKAIRQELFRVMLITLLVLAIGLGSIFAILFV